MTLTTHFVRRGMEAAHHMHGMMSSDPDDSQPGDGRSPQVNPVAALIFFLTGLLFMILLFSVRPPFLESSHHH